MSDTSDRGGLADPRDGYEGGQRGELVPLVETEASGGMLELVGALMQLKPIPAGAKRDYPAILAEFKGLCARNSERFVYRIPFKNRRKGTTEVVKGPTIQMTMAAMRLYGNCLVDCAVVDHGRYWMLNAYFADFEKRTVVRRSFQQRKGQDTGMRDDDRRLDMLLAMGVSKAERNVIEKALQHLCDEGVAAAESAVLDRIKEDPDKARNWIKSQFNNYGIPLERMERWRGKLKDMGAHDLAQVYMEIRAVAEDVVTPEDIWPDTRGQGEEAEKPKGDAKPAAATAKGKAAPKQTKKDGDDKKAKAEPEPEPEPEGEAEAEAEPEPEAEDGDDSGGGAGGFLFDEDDA